MMVNRWMKPRSSFTVVGTKTLTGTDLWSTSEKVQKINSHTIFFGARTKNSLVRTSAQYHWGYKRFLPLFSGPDQKVSRNLQSQPLWGAKDTESENSFTRRSKSPYARTRGLRQKGCKGHLGPASNSQDQPLTG